MVIETLRHSPGEGFRIDFVVFGYRAGFNDSRKLRLLDEDEALLDVFFAPLDSAPSSASFRPGETVQGASPLRWRGRNRRTLTRFGRRIAGSSMLRSGGDFSCWRHRWGLVTRGINHSGVTVPDLPIFISPRIFFSRYLSSMDTFRNWRRAQSRRPFSVINWCRNRRLCTVLTDHRSTNGVNTADSMIGSLHATLTSADLTTRDLIDVNLKNRFKNGEDSEPLAVDFSKS